MKALIFALDEVTQEMEEGDGRSIADKLGLGDFRNRFSQFTD